MICRYCQIIHSFDESYPLREATREVEGDYPRCDWHWRYLCSICGRPKHFNGMTWCEKTRRFICLSCAESHRIVRGKFWNWKDYYAIACDVCTERHPALDYLEFIGQHPWQLHPDMLTKQKGLDNETKLPGPTSSYKPFRKDVITEEQISQAWDNLADKWSRWYTDYGDINRRYIIDPALFRIISSVDGLSVLDAGCGNGYLCRLLAKKGAKIVGVDISQKFIEIAEQKEKETHLGIHYHSQSLCNLSIFGNETFDLIVSNLALMDVHDLEKAIRELHRVLKKKGKLVFSGLHPCFSSPPVHGWMKIPQDSNRKEDWIYWKVDRYFYRSMETWQYGDMPPTYSFHRPLSDYIKILLRNGFTITDFHEPIPSKKDIKEHFRELNDCDRIPWFLIIGAKKT